MQMASPVVRDLQIDEVPLLSWSGGAPHLQYIRAAVARRSLGDVEVIAVWIESAPVAVGAIEYADHDPLGKLWMLNVHPDHQSRGLGTLVIRELETRALARGCTTTALSVEKENVRARALYERLGYHTVGSTIESWERESESGRVFTYFADCYVMNRRLDDAPGP